MPFCGSDIELSGLSRGATGALPRPLFSLLFLLCASTNLIAQPWQGILSPSRAIDWSRAGVRGGIPDRTIICSTLNPGATVAQINSAISACPSGQVVFLNPGTYQLAGGIVFAGKSNVTLRGAGANQTFLVFSTSNSCHGYAADICVDSRDTNWPGGPTNSTTWTSGFTKGTTSITLGGYTNLKVGQPLLLDQVDDSADTGSKFVCQSQPCSLEGNNNNGARNNRDQEQIVQVVSCGTSTPGAACTSNNVTISPGLYADNWSSAKSPGAWWSSSPISGVGIENLSMDHSLGGRGIEIFNGIDCWVSGVRSIKSSRSHVEIMASARVTVQSSYFYLTQDAVSQSYGVSPYGSTDVLVSNNIFQYIATPLQVNGCTGCVISYNYAINNYYEGAKGYVMPAFMIHTAGVDLTLFEGNIGSQTYGDVFHGTHNLLTYFRNYFSGNQPSCYNGTRYQFSPCTSHQVPMEFQSYNRLFNVLGNVLGQSGVQTGYQSGKGIYAIGSGNSAGGVTVPSDPLVAATLMRWGNWDTVTNATRWCGQSSNTGWASQCGGTSEVPTGLSQYANSVPSTETLPASLYLSGRPSWWPISKVWPPIGPDVVGGNVSGLGGHVNSLPAQDCFSAVMGGPADGTGSVLTFNAASCYQPAASATPPAAPTNVSATVQ